MAILVLDRVNPTLVMGGAVLSLYFIGVINSKDLLSGFANESIAIVGSLYILAGAADVTGAFEGLTTRLLGGRGTPALRSDLLRVCLPAAAASAFIANTPLVAMLAPRIARWCKQTGRSSSRYLMPLSYAVILGGCVTMIGTSVNLFVNDLIQEAGLGRLGVFSIAGVGLPVAIGCIGLMVLIGPRVLPDRAKRDAGQLTDRQFTVEMIVAPNSGLVGITVAEAGLRNLEGVFLIEVQRGDKVIAAVGPEEPLAGGDRLAFVGDLARVLDLQRTPGLAFVGARYFDQLARDPQRRFVEAVVAVGSSLVSTNLKAAGFRTRYGAVVVAIHRSSEHLTGKLGDVRLRTGDVLLLLTGPDFEQRHRRHRDFSIVAPINRSRPVRRERAWIVELSIVLLIAVAGTGLLSLLQISLLLAFGLVAARVVTLDDARRFVGTTVLLLMALSFALGLAVEHSGLASAAARLIVEAAAPLGDYFLLAAVLLATMLVTEMISNLAAAALMFPVAISVAQQADAHAMPFAVIIVFGASLSFLTPIGYQTNTMVWAMGGYRYSDFARLGAPMTLLVLVATPLLVPIFFPYH